jgi:outer membrane cobalamin receptor
MPLYVSDTLSVLQNRFNVIYDNMNLLNIKASLGYVKVKDLQARLLANYYHYIPVDEEKAWQMPNYEIGLDAGYTFLEKYTLRASIMMIGSRYALVYNEGLKEAVKMKTAIDIGFGAEYRINKMISAFADINNILNQNYQRWYEYPVQGILVMAGVKLTF